MSDAPSGTTDASERSFRFTYDVRLTELSDGTEGIRLWIPVPQSDAHQTVSDLTVETNGTLQMATEPKYGNRFAYVEFESSGQQPTVTASYRVTRLTQHGLRAENETPRAVPSPLDMYLRPSRLIAMEGSVGEEARRIAGDASTPLDIARRLYDNIVSTVRYDKSGEGWGRGDSLYVCDSRAGNCTDFHSLFIGEARSLGVPARFVMGFPLPADAAAGTVAGYHCWAEFYTAEHGWSPIDASEAFNHPEQREFFFGNLDSNRIKFTTGRDITLPGMAGEPLNYAIYPYAEIDGAPHAGIEARYTYASVK